MQKIDEKIESARNTPITIKFYYNNLTPDVSGVLDRLNQIINEAYFIVIGKET